MLLLDTKTTGTCRAGTLQKKKAPGPDGYPAEIYQGLPDIIQPLCDLFNLILTSGSIPLPLLKLNIAPLDKPNKNPEECGAIDRRTKYYIQYVKSEKNAKCGKNQMYSTQFIRNTA